MFSLVAFVIVVVVIGLWKANDIRWWGALGLSIIFWGIDSVLFNFGGTLENPAGDGPITQAIRILTNDGPEMGLFAVVVLLTTFGIPLLLLAGAWRQIRKHPARK